MGGDDQADGEGEKGQFVRMPYLFGYQKYHPAYEQQQGDPAAMMTPETMPKGADADRQGQPDHPVFEGGIVNDVDAHDGQTGQRQGEDGAMDGARH